MNNEWNINFLQNSPLGIILAIFSFVEVPQKNVKRLKLYLSKWLKKTKKNPLIYLLKDSPLNIQHTNSGKFYICYSPSETQFLL